VSRAALAVRVARLDYLRGLLRRYAHRWSEFPSQRMQAWQAEYDDAHQIDPLAWSSYCAKHMRGADSEDHTAGGILA
jgi:hypothetical protein